MKGFAKSGALILLPGRGWAGKMKGLQAARAKCAVRYSLEELFWLNATVFCLQANQ